MTVCLVARRIWTHGLGGMETHCRLLTQELSRQGHTVHVLTTAHLSGRTEETLAGARIHYLPETPPGDYSRQWWRASRCWAQEYLEALGVDSILSMSMAGAAIAGIPNAPPLFLIIHGYGWPQLKSFWHESSGLRKVVVFPRAALRILASMIGSRSVLRSAAGVLAVSRELCWQLRRYRTHFMPNVVDTSQFRPDPARRAETRAALGISDTNLVALMVGTVNRQKGVDLGLQACADVAAQAPGLRAVVVGDGPAREALSRWARAEAPHLTVSFVGAQPHEALPAYYAAADIFLFPSRRQEGLPTTVLEAMATGLPAVATHSGGTPTAVRHGENGIVVRIGDAHGLAAALRMLIQDTARRRALGAAGLRAAREIFDVRKVAGQLVEIMRGARC